MSDFLQSSIDVVISRTAGTTPTELGTKTGLYELKQLGTQGGCLRAFVHDTADSLSERRPHGRQSGLYSDVVELRSDSLTATTLHLPHRLRRAVFELEATSRLDTDRRTLKAGLCAGLLKLHSRGMPVAFVVGRCVQRTS